MGFVIKFILLFALLGAAYGFLFHGQTRESFGQGAAGGVLFAAVSLVQLFFIGILSIAGIWLVMRIF
jgi:hypothetical protein